MRSFRARRAPTLAAILLAALSSSGCPELNRQPDYLGEKNSFMSVADPLPDDDACAARPASRVFDHASITIGESQGRGLSDQARRAQ